MLKNRSLGHKKEDEMEEMKKREKENEQEEEKIKEKTSCFFDKYIK
jgi:hypothetical protein